MTTAQPTTTAGPLARIQPVAGISRTTPAMLGPLLSWAPLVLAIVVAGPALLPHDPFDPAALDLTRAMLPPAWLEGGLLEHVVGTDEQGRDLLAATLHGLRLSFFLGLAATALAMLIGLPLGVLAGWAGGATDRLLMRLADLQLTFPALLTALLIDGLLGAGFGEPSSSTAAAASLALAIGLAAWPQAARLARARTQALRDEDFIAAARGLGTGEFRIALRHLLPHLAGPMTVLAMAGLGLAITTEATLSFLGLGLPPSFPSLGTLVRTGADQLYAGAWWLVLMPAAVLTGLILLLQLLADRLHDHLDPHLR